MVPIFSVTTWQLDHLLTKTRSLNVPEPEKSVEVLLRVYRCLDSNLTTVNSNHANYSKLRTWLIHLRTYNWLKQYLHLQSNQMLKPTGLPDCPIQANEDAANIELKQEDTIARDSVCWQETGTLESRHRQSTLSWGNGKGLGSKPGEGPSVPVLKR